MTDRWNTLMKTVPSVQNKFCRMDLWQKPWRRSLSHIYVNTAGSPGRGWGASLLKALYEKPHRSEAADQTIGAQTQAEAAYTEAAKAGKTNAAVAKSTVTKAAVTYGS